MNLLRDISIIEIIVSIVILVILFGGKKLNKLSKSIIEAIREFRIAFKNEDNNKDKPAK